MRLRDIVIKNRMDEDIEVFMRVETEFKPVTIEDEKEERLSVWKMEEEGTDIVLLIRGRWRDEE
ncbi:hypothetical protein DRO54_10425 [Candidatus Bathyarchaeota archaeon]|nr:MAG: hypothetical protein DRO54_10425 [Candidatus Bathyarchaeota archaeon]